MYPPMQTSHSHSEENMLTQNSCSEAGAGRGGGDLNQVHELELDDATAVEDLIRWCKTEIGDQEIRSKTIDLMINAKKTQRTAVQLWDLGLDMNHKTIPLAELPKLLAKLLVGHGGISQIEEKIETSSRSVIRGSAKRLETCLVGQELPSIIVSTFKTANIL